MIDLNDNKQTFQKRMTNHTHTQITQCNEKKTVLRNSSPLKTSPYQVENTSFPSSPLPPTPNTRGNLPGRKECGLILHTTRQEDADKATDKIRSRDLCPTFWDNFPRRG